jgi:membrane protease YdiL (CAAX protease family)
LSETIGGPKRGADDRQLSWKVFVVLMAGAVVGLLAVLPYYIALFGLPPELQMPLWQVFVLGLVQSLALFALAIALGLWLGGKVGLGVPVLRAWLSRDPEAPRRFRAFLPAAIGVGVAVGVVIILLERFAFGPLLPEALHAAPDPGPLQGLLASFYGGINEELLTRLGVMSLLVWLGTKVTRRTHPSAAILWVGNIMTALLFGAGHLPALAQLAPLTFILVVRTLLLNGIAGVAFGWLYWQRGLLAAIVAHFSADIVLHVIGAALA